MEINQLKPFLLRVVICSILSFKQSVHDTSLEPYFINGYAQGTSYHITYYAEQKRIYKEQIDRVFASIDSSLSIYKSYSLISQFNQSSRGIRSSGHLTKVVEKSLAIYRDTEGVFDITVYPLMQAWGFGPNQVKPLQTDKEVRSVLPCIGSNRIHLRRDSLLKDRPCTKIDVNGIAQGYSVDVLAGFMEANGITNYLLELGGELRVKGYKFPGHKKMQIGIELPLQGGAGETVIKKAIEIDSGAITTSGSYRNFRQADGKKITHLINPKTGLPVNNELISVTVLARDAITADGYDNALMGLGLKKAFSFLAGRRYIQAYFIYQKPDGTVADTATQALAQLLREKRTIGQ